MTSPLDKPLSEIISADKKKHKKNVKDVKQQKRTDEAKKQSQQRQKAFSQNRKQGQSKGKKAVDPQQNTQKRVPPVVQHKKRQAPKDIVQGTAPRQVQSAGIKKQRTRRNAATGKTTTNQVPNLKVTVAQTRQTERRKKKIRPANSNTNNANNTNTLNNAALAVSLNSFQQELLEAVRQTLPTLVHNELKRLEAAGQVSITGSTSMDSLFPSFGHH